MNEDEKKKLMNGSSNQIIMPGSAEAIPSGMKMVIGVKGDRLTLEFERPCDYLQFSKADGINFVQQLAHHLNTMKH